MIHQSLDWFKERATAHLTFAPSWMGMASMMKIVTVLHLWEKICSFLTAKVSTTTTILTSKLQWRNPLLSSKESSKTIKEIERALKSHNLALLIPWVMRNLKSAFPIFWMFHKAKTRKQKPCQGQLLWALSLKIWRVPRAWLPSSKSSYQKKKRYDKRTGRWGNTPIVTSTWRPGSRRTLSGPKSKLTKLL